MSPHGVKQLEQGQGKDNPEPAANSLVRQAQAEITEQRGFQGPACQYPGAMELQRDKDNQEHRSQGEGGKVSLWSTLRRRQQREAGQQVKSGQPQGKPAHHAGKFGVQIKPAQAVISDRSPNHQEKFRKLQLAAPKGNGNQRQRQEQQQENAEIDLRGHRRQGKGRVLKAVGQDPGKKDVGQDKRDNSHKTPSFKVGYGKNAEVKHDQVYHQQDETRLFGHKKGGVQETGEQADHGYCSRVLIEGKGYGSDCDQDQQAHARG